MSVRDQTAARCTVCQSQLQPYETLAAELVRPPIAALIARDHPSWGPQSAICLPDLNRYRAAYLQGLLETERGELSKLEDQVLQRIAERETLAENVNETFADSLKFGDRVSDLLAAFGGSWVFIILFLVGLISWALLNTHLFSWKPLDPYPYIFLNLMLSCLAAIQAPVILMSQNRQAAKDRLAADHDFQVNLKAELEIRNLAGKLDHMLMHQWQRLLAIQTAQVDILQSMSLGSERKPPMD